MSRSCRRSGPWISAARWTLQSLKTARIASTMERNEEEARRARRAIARINYMAQDRADTSVAARVLSQCMAGPREGVLPAIKRVIRYLRRYPRCIIEIDSDQQVTELDVWTDSDWAGDAETRKSCSGGSLQLGTSTIHHWSKLQANVALSSGEAELNSAVKGISEAIGLREVAPGDPSGDCDHSYPRGCKRMQRDVAPSRYWQGEALGRTKQRWVQGAVQAYGMKVLKVPRAENSADILTRPTTGEEMAAGLDLMGVRRELAVGPASGRKSPH